MDTPRQLFVAYLLVDTPRSWEEIRLVDTSHSWEKIQLVDTVKVRRQMLVFLLHSEGTLV